MGHAFYKLEFVGGNEGGLVNGGDTSIAAAFPTLPAKHSDEPLKAKMSQHIPTPPGGGASTFLSFISVAQRVGNAAAIEVSSQT